MPRLQRLLVICVPRIQSEFPLIVRHPCSRNRCHDWLAFSAGILVFAQTVDARSLAVTEFLNNPGVNELTEWVELYNYGSSALDLSGWMMKDENGESSALPSIILPSGSFLIMTANKAEFEAEWLGGSPNASVWAFDPGFQLANSGDQIIISNALAEVVWNIAWVNDELPGRATFLTSTDFAITDFGSLAAPGISRSSDDLGIPGFLGYQQNNFTNDPWAFSSITGDFGSPLAGSYAALPAPGGLWLLGLAILRRRRRRGRKYDSA